MDAQQNLSSGARVFSDLADHQHRGVPYSTLARAFLQIQDQIEMLRLQGTPTRHYEKTCRELSRFISHYEINKELDSFNDQYDFEQMHWNSLKDVIPTLELLSHQVSSGQPEIDEEARDEARQFLANAKAALLQDTDLLVDNRNYLAMLMRELEGLLDEQSLYGSFEIRASAERLVGVLYSFVPEEKRTKGAWKTVFQWTATVFVASMLTAGGQQTYTNVNDAVKGYLEKPAVLQIGSDVEPPTP